MIDMQGVKFVQVTPPAAVNDNAAFSTTTIDTLGFDYCTLLFNFGAMDIAMAVLKVQESDDSGMSGAVDITGAAFASLPTASDDNHLFVGFINLNGGRKRYLDVSATAGDGAVGTYMSAVAILSRAEQEPYDATTRGVTQQFIV